MTTSGISVHFSSAKDEWATPQELFDALDRIYHFTLDPCATGENAKCPQFYTREQDGLSQPWDGVVYVNPPYGRQIGQWVRKAFESSQSGATVVMLLPARTCTSWWHEFVVRGSVTFLRGRLKFGGAKTSAPFPSAIVVFSGSAMTPRLRQCGVCRKLFAESRSNVLTCSGCRVRRRRPNPDLATRRRAEGRPPSSRARRLSFIARRYRSRRHYESGRR
jgi:phage N-6-adenine-methyltransferase